MAVRDDFTAGEVLAAADLNDTFASKPPFAYGTATPSTTVEGFIWYDENDTPPTAKFWDGSAFENIAAPVTAPGLVHINTTTFSAVSSVSINDLFSATYDTYRIIMNATSASGNPDASVRLRASGTDDTSSNYHRQLLFGSSSTTGAAATSSTLARIGTFNTVNGLTVIEINNPFASVNKAGLSTSGSTAQVDLYSFRVSLASSFDGITILASSSTITGTIRVYGYKNS